MSEKRELNKQEFGNASGGTRLEIGEDAFAGVKMSGFDLTPAEKNGPRYVCPKCKRRIIYVREDGTVPKCDRCNCDMKRVN